MGGYVLALATCADTVAGAVMAVPVLVPHDLVDVVLIVRAQAEGAELTLALILDGTFLLTSLLL